ncbi:MAG: VCBS repeat-containing protein, partial [Chitinophagaceae bacterium]|nr:VCBS repeat-containing protein [Chitinophagaceae bacterium]
DRGIVTSAVFTNVNNDKLPDLVIVGEWMNINVFINKKGRFEGMQLPASTGMWQTVFADDINKDGNVDLLVGNWGWNNKFYSGKNGPAKLYVSDFDKNGQTDQLLSYTLNGQEFPFLAKDEVERPLPTLKKHYLLYSDYAGVTMKDVFYGWIDTITPLLCEKLGSVVCYGDGKGNFNLHELPAQLQLAPIFSFQKLNDGLYIAGGNFFDVIPYEGRYDAQPLALFSINNDSVQVIHQSKLNSIHQQFRDIKLIQTASGKKIIAAANNSSPIVFDLNNSVDKKLDDTALLELTQRQTFKYFWDYGHPVSGLARERSNKTFGYGDEVVTTGGSGFGIMAIIVAAERKWITKEEALNRLLKIARFLEKSDRFHGMFPHWLNGETGKTIPFSINDDGADIVETSFLFQGLLTAREYFKDNKELTTIINRLWQEADWTFFTRNKDVLYWHWSPKYEWKMNHEIRGWNECLITYIMAASSPTHSINANVYHNGWAKNNYFTNGKKYYGIELPLGMEYGGPLFFAHYSFLGLDPRGLKDQYADYWMQNKNHVLINRQYCIENPKKFKGYGENCWGLTASDNHRGYGAHAPGAEDLGVISPTAALSSFPYTPEYSMQALKYFYNYAGGSLFKQYGFADAFNESENWIANSHLAIDQGPIIVMIENYRSGLLWKLFMQNREILNGLRKLGFESPYLVHFH